MKKIILAIILVFISMTLISCKGRYYPRESGDFLYTKLGVVNPDVNLAIVGLSEEGKKKETLIFPTILDGFHAKFIGTRFASGNKPIEISNAKSVYFPSTIILRSSIKYQHTEEQNLNIYFGYRFPDPAMYPYKEQIKNSKIFVKYEYLMEEIALGYDNRYNYIPANIAYYIGNNEEDDLFFVDDTDGTKVNVIPPDPYKEGYNFIGWYKEIEGINKWDFENDIIPSKQYDEEGEYQFIETKIYAKWEVKQ
ncbi:InlB B-repeat-containing protein [Haploplasma axanthum]|nr:InlB B-repeat-containing protein [Haploplasma axanthum]